MYTELTYSQVASIERPWRHLSNKMLSSMIVTAKGTVNHPDFPKELQPKTYQIYLDLLLEKALRN